MKKITKIRLHNSYFYLSAAVLFLALSITWFFESNFAEIMFFMDYNAPDLAPPATEAKIAFLDSILTWEMFIDSSMRYVVNFFPVFAVLPVIPFSFERKSHFVFGANRFQHYSKELLKSILGYAIQGGLCVSIVFIIYFTIGSPFMIATLSDIGGFASALPRGFYSLHPYLFFIFMASTIYFAIGFSFALMACGISLFTDKEYFILAIPLMIYVGVCFLGYGFDFLPFKISESVCAFNTMYSTGEIFVPVIPLILIDTVLVIFGVKKRRNIIDC